MKKGILFICFLLGLAQSVFAQGVLATQTPGYTARAFPWQETLDNALSQQIPQQKPWQVALFLGKELRPTEETLTTLQEQMEKGHIARAAVLSFSKENKPILSVLFKTQAEENITLQQIPLLETSSPEEMLSMLLKELTPQAAFYTAVLVNANSPDGLVMRYANEQILLLSQVITAIKSQQIYVDVLDMQVCHMGNVFSAYQLAKSHRVHYALLSSNRRRGSKQTMYYRLLTQLDLPPQQAALAALEDLPSVENFANDRYTHNLFLLDVKKLDPFFQSWRGLTGVLSLPAHTVSFAEYLLTAPSAKVKQQAQAIEQATLAQWCYSPHTKQLHKNSFPAESECINGLSVNRETARLLK